MMNPFTKCGLRLSLGLRTLAVGSVLSLALSSSALAGGYLSHLGSSPDSWGGTVTVNLDLGGLGTLSNAAADTLALDALGAWGAAGGAAQVPTSSLTFAQGTDLASDQTGANTTIFGTVGDGISPIAYDTDGTLTDAILGAGASLSVLGFAGPQAFSGNTITEGRAALNGLFIDGLGAPTDVTLAQFEGVIAHEFGHMLNLDHSVVNESAALALTPGSLDPRDFTGFPTMFPLVHGDIDTLETDDKVWISNLYPTAGFTSTTSNFTGTVRNAAAAPIDGIDIVCRDISDPRNSVITCVSGFTPGSTGTYEIPGLTPGNKYVLDFEQLRSSFIGGSRVGPLGAQLNLTAVGMPEFVNATGESMSDALGATSTFVAPAAMTSTALPDLTLNGAPGTLAIVETDPGALITSFHGDDITADVAVAVMAGSVLSITGSADQAEAGDLDFGSGDIEDYYFIDASTIPFPVEVFEVRVTPTGGAVDLYVISWDLGGGGSLSAAGSTAGGVGVAEEIDRHWEPTRFGSGGAADLMIIGVGTDTGGAIPYTLTVAATRMDTVGGSTVYADEPSTNGGTLFVNGSTNEIRGVNFSMTGGTPAVTTTDPQISVDSVAFVGSTQLDVMLSDAGSFVPGPVTLTITNPAAAGGSSGDITLIPALVPVELSVFETE